MEDVYPIVWLDAIHYKARDEGKVKSRAVYHILAINNEGKKDLLQDNWHKLSTYFKYTADIRRIIYTANTIEGFH